MEFPGYVMFSPAGVPVIYCKNIAEFRAPKCTSRLQALIIPVDMTKSPAKREESQVKEFDGSSISSTNRCVESTSKWGQG